jgi:hypothetical protein
VPEVNDLALWLVTDDYVSAVQSGCTSTTGICIWKNRAPTPAYGVCTTSCPDAFQGKWWTLDFEPNNPDGFPYPAWFSIADESNNHDLFTSQTWTFFLVANPSTQAPAYGGMLDLYDGSSSHVKLQRDGSNDNLVLQVTPGSASGNYIVSAPSIANAWSGNWERIYAYVDASGNALLSYQSTASGAIGVANGPVGAPSLVEYSAGVVGTEAQSTGVSFQGQIAEVIVFKNALLSGASQVAIQGYLSNRYGF